MTGARVLLYAHCLVAIACTGLTVFALERKAQFGGQFSSQLEDFFAHPVVAWVYLSCLLSCLVFPAGVAFKAVGRMSAWRWAPAVAADACLALLQYSALVIVYPARY